MQPNKLCVDIHAKVVAARSSAASTTNPQSDTTADAVVTPWEVQGKVDYDKLIGKFGCTKIDEALIAKIRSVTKADPHVLIRRGIVFSHRDLDRILDNAAKGFYLYTGRGPSSSAMHLGHIVPFTFTRYLQAAFDVPLVIQITDDEKFLFKNGLDHAEMDRIAVENIKDIIAIGFDPRKTFIFRNYEYLGRMYRVVSKIQKSITASQARNCFGFKMEDNIGMWSFPAIQAAPCFSEAFPGVLRPEVYAQRAAAVQAGTPVEPEKPSLFKRIMNYFFPPTQQTATQPLLAPAPKKAPKGKSQKNKPQNIPCLIPCAIDQDPYFRLTRDIAPRLGYLKPSLIHATFLPSLLGPETKMSGSAEGTCIYLTDTDKEIDKKIKKFAFSGGGATLEEHREKGGNADIDVPIQWLKFFMPWDFDVTYIPGCTDEAVEPGRDPWEVLKAAYERGTVTSSTVKAVLIGVVQAVVEDHRSARKKVTDADVADFMRIRPIM